MSNRDRIDRAMGYLAAGLGPFVDSAMAAVASPGKEWMKALADRNPQRYSAGQTYSPSDPRFLLRVITEEWRTFRDQLSRVQQGYATELRDAGNRWAHGQPFTADDTYRTLDTMERLLTAVGAAEQADQVHSLKIDLQGSPSETATPSTAPRPARSDAPPRGSPGTARFWSAVARSDVVRAIEEYDRLGQDQFLYKYGFGRATAYLLIHGGRSYDSKAILGVAYRFATGVPLGAHEFNGGIYGAAAVLQKLGFEVRNIRDVPEGIAYRAATPALAGTPASQDRSNVTISSEASLDGIDPQRSLIVLTCSARKDTGGRPSAMADPPNWPQALQDARAKVLATAGADASRVLPAWCRYTGTFYQYARPALADATTTGHVVIISGGYGLVRADEPIAWYDKMLQLTEWPVGLLESALIEEARRCAAETVVAFASATTEYAKLLRRTPWEQAGIDARLVTITGVTGGAMSEVPRRLAQAFTQFWNREDGGSYPPGTTVEQLRAGVH
jgi:hypothetical protein